MPKEEMELLPFFIFERWFNRLTGEDLKHYGISLMEFINTRELIDSGKIKNVQDKTVFKILKICLQDLKERGILKT